MRQRANGLIQHYSRMVENLLELGGSGDTLALCQVGFPTQVNGIERKIRDASRIGRSSSQFIGCSRSECVDCLAWATILESISAVYGRQIVDLHDRIDWEAFG